MEMESILCLVTILSLSFISTASCDYLQQNENANVLRVFAMPMASGGKTFTDEHGGRYSFSDPVEDKRHKLIVPKDERKPVISEFKLTNDTHGYALVTWTHFDSRVLYILTCNKVKEENGRSYCVGKSNVYRSIDHGASFQKENHKFQNKSEINAVYTSPVDRKIIQIYDQQNQRIYSSVNEGESYNLSKVSFSPLSISFHPKFSNYIMIKDTQSNIYMTNNTGKDWTFVCSKVNKYFWADKDSSHPEIFLEVNAVQGGKLAKGNLSSIYVAKLPFDGHVKEFSRELGPINPNSFVVKQDYLFIWRKTSAGNSRLFASYKRQSFKECVLPDNDLYVKFHIIDAKGEIMLAALNRSGFTNLFISDKTATKFSLALKNIRASWSTEKPIIDLHQVSGLPGTLLANEIERGTLISYNKGGSWSLMRPPSYDTTGKSTECMLPDCKLRLSLYIRDSYASGWSPVVSSKTAPGIIIAQGWLQYNDIKNAQYISSYASNNGGQTWKQILKGRQIVKLLDHGGIVAAIPLLHSYSFPEMNKLEYSCNEGASWSSVVLSNQAERFVGVASHPAAKASLLTIFAVDLSPKKLMTWKVWKVNFTSLFHYKCFSKNYTLWTASSNLVTGACVLGQKYIFEKRKSEICCYNGLDYKPLVNISTCECTINDFNCDFGFQRDNLGSLCVPTSFAVLDPPVNCPEGGHYKKSKGYVKVVGDGCQGGIIDEIKPVKVQCPARAPNGLSLSVQKYSIALGKSAVIILRQKSGFLGTKYTWNFGDNVMKYNLSFEKARVQNHTYQQVGTYIIELLASNKAGSYTAKTVMRIIERVSEIVLDVTKPVVAMEEAIYTVTVKTEGKKVQQRHGFVHFAWIFEPIKTPVLSLNSSVKHTYPTPGTYEVEVQVFNAISVASTTTTVTVFGDVRVISLQFSSTLDLLNTGQQLWIQKFKLFIYDYIIKTFNVYKEMLEVDVSETLPTIVTLSLVQNKVPKMENPKKSRQSIDKVMHEIIDRVKSKKVVFFLFGQEIRVLTATIIRDKKVEKKKNVQEAKVSSRLQKYLYIGLPVAVIFAVFLLLCCYRLLKRRCTAKPTNYLQMEDENDPSRLQQFGLEDFDQT